MIEFPPHALGRHRITPPQTGNISAMKDSYSGQSRNSHPNISGKRAAHEFSSCAAPG
jgi:hypothetical protein